MVDLTSIIAVVVVISLTTIILRKHLIEAFFFGLIVSGFVAYMITHDQAIDSKKPLWIFLCINLIYYLYLIIQSIHKSQHKITKTPIFSDSNVSSLIVGKTGSGGISDKYYNVTFILDLAKQGGIVHYISLKPGEETKLSILEFLEFIDPMDNLSIHQSKEEAQQFLKEFSDEIELRTAQLTEGRTLEEMPVIYLIYNDDDQYLSESIFRLLNKYKNTIRNLRIVFVLSENIIEHLDLITEKSVSQSNASGGSHD